MGKIYVFIITIKKNKEKGLKGKLLYLKRQILKIEWGILKYILLKNKNKGNKDIITYDWKMADYQAKFKYNDIFPLSKVKFEGTEYNAPKDIHLYPQTYTVPIRCLCAGNRGYWRTRCQYLSMPISCVKYCHHSAVRN